MAPVEERLRRSLASRANDVRPDQATWERVRSRIRRRAWVTWSAAGATVAAALVLAALLLPGLLGETRVDLSPAGPPPAGATLLVTTDGRALHVTDLDGEVLDEIEPPAEAGDPLPITRVAVRPGSTHGDLTVVYLRADAACERVEVGWVTVDADGTSGGALGGGQGSCITDPVWSPDGTAVAWVVGAGSTSALQVQPWSGGPGGRSELLGLGGDLNEVADLRASDWWWNHPEGDVAEGILSLSAVGADRTARALALPLHRQADGAVTLDPGAPEGGPAPEPLDPSGGAVRSAVMVSSHDRSPGLGEYGYELGVDGEGAVLLSRLADGAEPARNTLHPGVLSAEDVDRGDAWLSARGAVVALGAGDRAWVLRWEGDGWDEITELPGTVHAVVMPAPAADPGTAPGAEPAGVQLVGTDGRALTLTTAEGEMVLTEAVADEISDFAVHPDSTPDDLTLVWREGTGCEATLRHLTVAGGRELGSGTVHAECPGRPVFSPDGGHLVWVADTAATGDREFSLETVPWSDGPGESVTIFGLPANPAEITAVTALDWVWADGTGTARTGHLLLAGTDSHGTVSALTAPVERQGDGELALPAGATAEQVTPFEFAADQDRFAVLQAGSGADDGTAPLTYTLEQRVRDDGEDELAVVRSVGDDQAGDGFPVPSGLLRVNTTGAVDEVWMTARDDDVLLGDGAGRAWRLRWTGDGWSGLEALDAAVRYAVPLGGHQTPPPGDDPRAPDAPSPDPDEPEGLPAAVSATREAILEAARAGDVEALAALTGDGFTSSFGGADDPEAFFTRLRDEGELDRLVRVLELPAGEQDGLYSWPFAHTRDLGPPDGPPGSAHSLSPAELRLLETVASAEEIERWIEGGSGYLGWRAGIEADGTWRFYVAGD